MKLVFKDFEGSDKPNDGPVTSATAPLVFVALASYMTASIFLGCLDTAVLSQLTCQSMDEDKNGEGNCQFGPPTFHEKSKKHHDDYMTAG
jgi:hypothetical protein